MQSHVEATIDANIECPSKPEYVHLWPLLSVFEFELV